MQIKQFISKVSPKGWAMLGGAAAIAILFLYFVFNMASQPSYTTLMSGVDPAQTGKITAALSAKGIPYQLQNNGTAVGVTSDQVAQARVVLAGQGLLNGSQPGMELFDKQQLGASNFQQQITYQRALEGQLEQTIGNISGISGATVQLVIPDSQSQLFSESSSQATAAVLLAGGQSLDAGSVKGIAQLVASSVPGLSVNKVTITDSSGALLWPNANGGGGAGGALSKQSAQQQYDATMAAQVNAMLTQTLGPGKAEVQVNADLNADQATTDSLTYAKKGVPLTAQTQNETMTGSASAAGGATGVTANLPAVANTGTGGGGSGSKYNSKTSNITYGVGKTVTHSVIAPGNVNQQHVSVLVDKSVPAAQLPALKAAVANAVGLVAKRGDTISFGQIAFSKTAAGTPAAAANPMSKMMGYAKYAIFGILGIVFLFLMSRMVRRREREDFGGNATWLRELSDPRPLAALEGGEGQTQVMQLQSPANPAKRQIEDLVERDPDRVAQQVRAWMNED